MVLGGGGVVDFMAGLHVGMSSSLVGVVSNSCNSTNDGLLSYVTRLAMPSLEYPWVRHLEADSEEDPG